MTGFFRNPRANMVGGPGRRDLLIALSPIRPASYADIVIPLPTRWLERRVRRRWRKSGLHASISVHVHHLWLLIARLQHARSDEARSEERLVGQECVSPCS